MIPVPWGPKSMKSDERSRATTFPSTIDPIERAGEISLVTFFVSGSDVINVFGLFSSLAGCCCQSAVLLVIAYALYTVREFFSRIAMSLSECLQPGLKQ